MTRGGILGVALRGLRRVLRGIAWFSVFHPWSVIALVVIATIAAGWAAWGLTISTDIDSLLPRSVASAQRMRDLFDRYGGSEPIVIAISGEGERDIDERVDLALTLQDALAEAEFVRVASGLFGEDPWALLDGPQIETLLLYLEPRQIDAVAAATTSEAIDARVARNRGMLRSPIGPVASRLIAEDPLGFLDLILGRLAVLKGELGVVPRDGVLVTEDASHVLVFARPKGSSHDLTVARTMLSEIEAAARTTLSDLGLEGSVGIGPAPEPTEGEGAPRIHIGLTGSPALLVDYHEILQRDIRSISGLAFLAVLVLFLLAFRRLSGVCVAGIPLAVGVIWSLAFARLAIGEINVFTAGSIAILCGLAIDFTIHLYNRYLEEAHDGRDMWRAFQAAHGEAGLGIVAAAGTTAWAFLAAGFSRFRGLRDLGLICSAGIVLSLVAALVLVPALTAVFARLRPAPDRPRGLAGFGLTPVLRVVTSKPRRVVALGVVAVGLLCWPAVTTHVDEDFRKFRPTSAPSIRLQQDLGRRIGASLQPVAAVVTAQRPEELLESCARVESRFVELIGEGESDLCAVIGPSVVVPPLSSQRRVLARLRTMRAEGTIDPARVERDLLEAFERHGFRVGERARHAAARVRAILAIDEELSLDTAREGPLGEVLGDLLIARSDGGVDGLVTAYPRLNAKTSDLVQVMRDAVERAGVRADLIGGRVLSQEIKPLVIRDGVTAAALSAVGVLFILLLVFRRPVLVLWTFVPLVVGVFASIGLMTLLGVNFNLVSISMVPLILGIGIDNGIHIVHRSIEHRSENLVEVFQHTGRGIVMTSLTTMVGFGALIFADYPGLVSSGVLAILGVGTTLIAAVVLLPALLRLTHLRS